MYQGSKVKKIGPEIDWTIVKPEVDWPFPFSGGRDKFVAKQALQYRVAFCSQGVYHYLSNNLLNPFAEKQSLSKFADDP